MSNLILILGDQLTTAISALDNADRKRDRIVMAEVHDEASYTNHPQEKTGSAVQRHAPFRRGIGASEIGWRTTPGNL